jgi:acyl-coenzyme A thioesterase PaaI-like protein
MYLSTPWNEFWDAGVRISEAEAEILLPIQQKSLHTSGAIYESIYVAAMGDSARLAVNSVSGETLVVTVSFHVQFSGPCVADELIARGRFLGMSGDHYLAESVLTDPEGIELGRGHGEFVASSTVLAPELGYE